MNRKTYRQFRRMSLDQLCELVQTTFNAIGQKLNELSEFMPVNKLGRHKTAFKPKHTTCGLNFQHKNCHPYNYDQTNQITKRLQRN